MNLQDVFDYCSGKRYAYTDQPFGFDSMLFKVASHYFCILYELKGREAISVKCTPQEGEMLRDKYAPWVVRGYHCPPAQQPYNNTIYLDGDVQDEEIYRMIDRSYELVLSKLTRKERIKYNIDGER